MSSKRGIPKVAGVVLACVGVAVSVIIVVMTLSTMGTMRDNAAKARGASTQSPTTVASVPTTEAATEAATESAPPVTEAAPSTAPTTTESVTESAPVSTNSSEQQVVVESDDTLSGLSREYGRSVDAIANHNGIRDVNLIYDGSVLVIPESCDGY